MQIVSSNGIHDNQVWQKSDVTGENKNVTNINDSNNAIKQEKDGVTLELSNNEMERFKEELEAQKRNADAAAEGFQDLAKLMTIARRIANGDKVPSKDEKKLMEFSSELYQSSKAAAMLNAHRKHKEYKSLFDDEEKSLDEQVRDLERENSSGTEGDVSVDAPVEASVDVIEE